MNSSRMNYTNTLDTKVTMLGSDEERRKKLKELTESIDRPKKELNEKLLRNDNYQYMVAFRDAIQKRLDSKKGWFSGGANNNENINAIFDELESQKYSIVALETLVELLYEADDDDLVKKIVDEMPDIHRPKLMSVIQKIQKQSSGGSRTKRSKSKRTRRTKRNRRTRRK